MERRFKALRTIGMIFKVVGVILGIVAIFFALGVCVFSILGGAAVDSVAQELGGEYGVGVFSGAIGGIVLFLFTILSFGFPALWIYGLGELFFLFIAVEENTRATNILLQKPDNLQEENLQ